jgi:hypothetical protein
MRKKRKMKTSKGIIGTALIVSGMVISILNGEATATAEEDEPGWSCVDDGNRVCGPGNEEGKPAGCYDDGGVMYAEWPCRPWEPKYGWQHANGTWTFPSGTIMTPDGEEVGFDPQIAEEFKNYNYDDGSYVGGYN